MHAILMDFHLKYKLKKNWRALADFKWKDIRGLTYCEQERPGTGYPTRRHGLYDPVDKGNLPEPGLDRPSPQHTNK